VEGELMSQTIQFSSDQSASDPAGATEAELADQSLPAPAQPVIVVGYSARPEGRAALERALSEARLRGATLVVLNSSSELDAPDLAEELAASGISYEIRTADVHDSAEALITTAKTTEADFIVIGLRRRSPVGKLLLGSNAQRVLLDAACPVLAVKAEPDAS
jgi:nucleotide-binding universal stress UspA family protein